MSDVIIRCRWVPFKDRIPPEGEWVLLAFDGTAPTGTHGERANETHFEVCYRQVERWLIAANTEAEFVNRFQPTHWMALPSPPIGTPPDFACRIGGD
jgi:hypothetical protein